MKPQARPFQPNCGAGDSIVVDVIVENLTARTAPDEKGFGKALAQALEERGVGERGAGAEIEHKVRTAKLLRGTPAVGTVPINPINNHIGRSKLMWFETSIH